MSSQLYQVDNAEGVVAFSSELSCKVKPRYYLTTVHIVLQDKIILIGLHPDRCKEVAPLVGGSEKGVERAAFVVLGLRSVGMWVLVPLDVEIVGEFVELAVVDLFEG